MATVWGAIAVAGLLAVAGVLWFLGHVAVQRHQAANAADLAALAAAGRAERGTDEACGTARTVTGRMGVRLAECSLNEPDALVIVEAGGAPLGPVTARARAGPVDTQESPGTSSHAGPEPDGTATPDNPATASAAPDSPATAGCATDNPATAGPAVGGSAVGGSAGGARTVRGGRRARAGVRPHHGCGRVNVIAGRRGPSRTAVWTRRVPTGDHLPVAATGRLHAVSGPCPCLPGRMSTGDVRGRADRGVGTSAGRRAGSAREPPRRAASRSVRRPGDRWARFGAAVVWMLTRRP